MNLFFSSFLKNNSGSIFPRAKKFIALGIIFLSVSRFSFSQNISINTTGNPANSTALLDVDASPGNNKGVLLPRMNTTQRNAIASPATGLLLYNTDCNAFNYFNGTTWLTLAENQANIPNAPAASAAGSLTQTSFNANWAASSWATTYYLDVNSNSSFTGTWFVNNSNVGNVLTYNVTGLTCNTSYYYRVRAYNCYGTSTSSGTITATTLSCCTSGSQTFSYTGGSQTFNVTAGMASCGTLTIKVWGAGGGGGGNDAGSSGNTGGGGAYSTTSIAAVAGQVLTVYTGGGGTGGAGNVPGGIGGGPGGYGYGTGARGGNAGPNGWSAGGGGGGGSSAVYNTTTSTLLKVSAGGGGGGGAGLYSNGARGGGGGQNGDNSSYGSGGCTPCSGSQNGAQGYDHPDDGGGGGGGGGGLNNAGNGGTDAGWGNDEGAGGGAGGNSSAAATNGNYQTPGNSGDPALCGGCAVGGNGGSGNGGNGFVKISW